MLHIRYATASVLRDSQNAALVTQSVERSLRPAPVANLAVRVEVHYVLHGFHAGIEGRWGLVEASASPLGTRVLPLLPASPLNPTAGNSTFSMSERSSRNVKRPAAQAARMAASRQSIGQLARLGYFAIGIVYLMIAVLAVLGLLGIGSGQYTGSGGATRTILAQPFGRVLLAIIGVGLLTYVTWRTAQSVFDIEGRGQTTGGLLRRAGLALSALSYTGLTIEILRLLITGGGSLGGGKSDWTKTLMSHPAGVVLVGLLGLGILAVATVQLWMAYRAPFLDQITAEGKSRRWINRLGRLGFCARAVVFSIVGGFLIISALQTNPDQAKGLGGALRTLGRQPYGRFLIGAVALGLLCYGLFMVSKARFRHLVPGSPGDQDDAPQ